MIGPRPAGFFRLVSFILHHRSVLKHISTNLCHKHQFLPLLNETHGSLFGEMTVKDGFNTDGYHMSGNTWDFLTVAFDRRCASPRPGAGVH